MIVLVAFYENSEGAGRSSPCCSAFLRVVNGSVAPPTFSIHCYDAPQLMTDRPSSNIMAANNVAADPTRRFGWRCTPMGCRRRSVLGTALLAGGLGVPVKPSFTRPGQGKEQTPLFDGVPTIQ